MLLYIPKNYTPSLDSEKMELAIKQLKDDFQAELTHQLNLRRVTAPLFVLSGTGVNDDLNGTERAVSFPIKDMGNRRAEVVHSLAKWKRMKLGAYNIPAGYGLYTDMNAIRADEELDNLHSLYVDQWDWEQTITQEDRTIEFLKSTVKKIYQALKTIELKLHGKYPHISPTLPSEIRFFHSEELLSLYPKLSPRERETKVAEKYGAVFVIGIGAPLADGKKHDGRAPDYDD
ncbi:MAG TPA: aspartate--ammonia ligase, partial [Paludibacteraceae bacterium]|nr:aspartate--ammonia ligase [Paludibacteraceae bacterium]